MGREKGVFVCLSDKVKYNLRNDLCEANLNYESCFVEIENVNKKNINIWI